MAAPAELAHRTVFPYACRVKSSVFCLKWPALIRPIEVWTASLAALALCSASLATQPPQERPDADAPVVTKVEPPSWWINLTPEVLLLLSGRHLEATHANCNLSSVVVERTQSTVGGDYLFVWLKIAPDAKSGTAVCRLATPTGNTSFELPLAPREQRMGRNQGISPEDVIYLIMPDRFANGDPANDEPAEAPGTHDRSNPRAYHGGDLRGILQHLSYLKELGVTALWLTPIVKNGAAQDYHGYGAVDLYAVDPHLGTVQDYRDLVAEAHKQHMKILFDFVPNHVGPKHPWVAEPPMPDWFHGTLQHHLSTSEEASPAFYGKADDPTKAHDPFELLVDPHAPPRFSKDLTEGWFFGALPDLNTENPLVAEYLWQESIWWAETSGLDGFRLDTFPYVSREFWSAWHARLRQIYPYLTTIGEVFHPDPSVTSFFQGGVRRYDGVDSGLNTLFDYPMYFVLRDVLLRDAPAGRIADVLRHDSLYVRPASLVTFFGNHDVPRFAGAEGASIAKLELAFGLTLTMRGIPELYYGDEIGMPGGGDPDNRRDFPGGWPGDAKNAFTPQGRAPEQQELFAYVQALLHLRRQHPALQTGKMWHLFSDEASYVFLRETEEERILVAFNNSKDPRALKVPLTGTPAGGAAGFVRLLGPATATALAGETRLAMAPKSVSIFLVD
ncbi:MAG TPA: alpha-amylase family glycosyl hydrolase [Candidatus Methylomirabilis sp.]|nr:alpha-amylase family glycosyl hydrolase [Candidatus Methylomirabilis sp.]